MYQYHTNINCFRVFLHFSIDIKYYNKVMPPATTWSSNRPHQSDSKLASTACTKRTGYNPLSFPTSNLSHIPATHLSEWAVEDHFMDQQGENQDVEAKTKPWRLHWRACHCVPADTGSAGPHLLAPSKSDAISPSASGCRFWNKFEYF